MMEIKIQAQSENPDLIFTWTPEQVDFAEILIGQKSKFNVQVTNKDSIGVDLVVIGEPLTEFVKKYSIKDKSLEPAESAQIEFEMQKDIAPGQFKTALTLEAEGRPNTRITIPITGKVVEKLSEKPTIADKVANPAAVKVEDKKTAVKTDTKIETKPSGK
jgi:hypothetical protein